MKPSGSPCPGTPGPVSRDPNRDASAAPQPRDIGWLRSSEWHRSFGSRVAHARAMDIMISNDDVNALRTILHAGDRVPLDGAQLAALERILAMADRSVDER